MTRKTWRNIFIGIIFLSLLNYPLSISLFAQSSPQHNIITIENIDNLVEIQSWSIASDMVNGYPYPIASFNPDASELAIYLDNEEITFISTETFQTIRTISVETETEWINYSLDGSEVLLSNSRGQYTLIDIESEQILALNTISYDEDTLSPTHDVRKYIRWNYFDGGISVYDTITGQETLVVEDAHYWKTNYDGTLLLTRNDALIITIWDIDTGEIIFEILPPDGDMPYNNLYGAGFTPDGLVWANYPQRNEVDNLINWDSPIRFWDISSGDLLYELDGDEYYSSLTFDSSNTYALTWGLHIQSYSNQCWGWNLQSQERFACPAGGNMQTTLSPNDDILAINSGTDFNIHLYQFGDSMQRVYILETDPTWFVQFSSDGKFLLTIDTFSSIHLWAIPSN